MATIPNRELSAPTTPKTQDLAAPLSPPQTTISVNSIISSPRSSRKRTNDEIYKRHQPSLSSPSNFSKFIVPCIAPDERSQTQSLNAHSIFEHNGLEALPQAKTSQSLGDRHPDPQMEQDCASSERRSDSQEQDSFLEQIKHFQGSLEDEYTRFEQDLQDTTNEDFMESTDWDELESRYEDAMKPMIQQEIDLIDNFSSRFQHFILWMNVANRREADRAVKRLRTRVAFVKCSEDRLAERQAHYEKVLTAFQNAMALLGNV